MRRSMLRAAFACAALALAACAQTQATAQPSAGVTVDRITVHGASLEGNLEGNSPDRSVFVYLPPSYGSDTTRRYPVVYALHGYSINNEIWSGEIQAPRSIQAAYEAGAREMIVVLPSAQTVHNGSMYSSSVTIGDWESFIARDLVAYIDANYRTIANRESRGLAGHSMGGYGAIRIGMKHPEVFSNLYVMSPCCLSARGAPPGPLMERLAAIRTPEEASALGFFERATMAVGAAWSPNPNKPPLYMDLPVGDEATRNEVTARWAANAPLAMLDQYMLDLRKYEAIAIDVGDQDGLRTDALRMNEILVANGVASTFTLYEGDHVNRLPDRMENHVIPFFSQRLAFE